MVRSGAWRLAHALPDLVPGNRHAATASRLTGGQPPSSEEE